MQSMPGYPLPNVLAWCVGENRCEKSNDSKNHLFMSSLSNTLSLKVFLAVYSGHVTTIRLECDRLPWVSEAGASSAGALKVIVDEVMSDPGNDLEAAMNAISEMIKKMQKHFEQEFSIFCSLHLYFILEEQEENAIENLALRLQITDDDPLLDVISRASSPFSFELKPLDQVFQQNGSLVTHENFELRSEILTIAPGKPIHFELRNKEPVRCTEVFLTLGNTELLRYKSLWRMEANALTTIQLPGIPAAMLRHFLQSEVSPVMIHLVLDGASEALCLDGSLPHAPVILRKSPVSLFLDVGSAQTKFLIVAHQTAADHTAIDEGSLSDELRNLLIAAAGGDDSCVTLDPPMLTTDFREKFDLPPTTKQKLDKSSNAVLVEHFSDSIARLAKHNYLHEQRLIANVFWAFPNTKNKKRDFAVITQHINKNLGGAILGNATITAEADCLRAEFSRTLHALSLSASSAEERKRYSEQKQAAENHRRAEQAKAYEEHQKEFFLLRWAKKLLWIAPEPVSGRQDNTPIPQLEPWQNEFLKLTCDENLSQFVAFDAGGYSLDVFGSFANHSSCDLSVSFDAGSSRINDYIIKELKQNHPNRPEQELRGRAEEIKLEVCGDPEKKQQHAFYSICKNATDDVYGKYLSQIVDQLAAGSQQKSFPVILTGGGGHNQFLCKLLEQKLIEKGFCTIAITSPMLYSTLRNLEVANQKEIKLFLCMASAFHPELDQPQMAPHTDILGGLAQLAIGET